MRHSATHSTRRTLAVLWFGLVACGGGDAQPTSPVDNGGGGGGGGSTSNQISVADNSFTPSQTTVAAGTTVVWTWQNTSAPHNVTFAAGLNATDMQTGTFQRQFSAAGTFSYSCTNHPGMNGTIIVP